MKKMMKGRYLFFSLQLWLVVSVCHAHDGGSLHTLREIEINASPQQVWDIIKAFGNAHHWMPMVKSTHATGANTPGAIRILNLVNGGSLTEKLKRYDNDKMFMLYRMTEVSLSGNMIHHEPSDKIIDVPVFPVSYVSARIRVAEKAGKALVSWKARYYRAMPGSKPSAELNDAAAKKAVSKWFESGLKNLKIIAESK